MIKKEESPSDCIDRLVVSTKDEVRASYVGSAAVEIIHRNDRGERYIYDFSSSFPDRITENFAKKSGLASGRLSHGNQAQAAHCQASTNAEAAHPNAPR